MDTKQNSGFMKYIRDIIYIALFLITSLTMFISFSNRFVIVEKTVQQHTEMLKTNDLNIINYRLNEIDKKVDKILEKLEE
jgi:hypothetical protein